MTFSKEEFRIALIKNRMTMSEAAEKLGMKAPALSKRVNGSIEWKLEEISKVFKLFGNEAGVLIFLND